MKKQKSSTKSSIIQNAKFLKLQISKQKRKALKGGTSTQHVSLDIVEEEGDM